MPAWVGLAATNSQTREQSTFNSKVMRPVCVVPNSAKLVVRPTLNPVFRPFALKARSDFIGFHRFHHSTA